MLKKIFSILIIFILFITPVVEVSAVAKTPTKTTTKTTAKKTVNKKPVTKKKVAKKKSVKKVIANPPLITLETAPHSPKPASKVNKRTKKKKT